MNLNYEELCKQIHDRAEDNKFLQLHTVINLLTYQNKFNTLNESIIEDLLKFDNYYATLCIPYWFYNQTKSDTYTDGFSKCSKVYESLKESGSIAALYKLTDLKHTSTGYAGGQENIRSYCTNVNIADNPEDAIVDVYFYSLCACKVMNNKMLNRDISHQDEIQLAKLLLYYVEAFERADLDTCLKTITSLQNKHSRLFSRLIENIDSYLVFPQNS